MSSISWHMLTYLILLLLFFYLVLGPRYCGLFWGSLSLFYTHTEVLFKVYLAYASRTFSQISVLYSSDLFSVLFDMFWWNHSNVAWIWSLLCEEGVCWSCPWLNDIVCSSMVVLEGKWCATLLLTSVITLFLPLTCTWALNRTAWSFLLCLCFIADSSLLTVNDGLYINALYTITARVVRSILFVQRSLSNVCHLWCLCESSW